MEKYNKNDNTDTFYISEKQAIRGIFIGVALLCIIIIASYIVGYRAAIHNLTEETKKTSFADQVYTALSGRFSNELLDDDSHRYYIKILGKNINEIENIIEAGSQNGIFLMCAPESTLDDKEKKCHYIISSLIDSYNDAATIITALRNKVVIDEYEIIKIDK